MVAPAIAGALIKGATSLLGGLFGSKNQNEWVTPNYADIRAKSEAAGFNPLAALQSAPGQAMASQNYMGAAIADAGMAMADAVANKTKNEQIEQLNQLEIDNAKLQNKLMQLTLRPKVEGVYAQREETPTVQQAVGGKDAKSSSVAVADTDAVADSGSGYGVVKSPEGTVPLYVWVYDPDTKRTIRMPNPDLLDAGMVDTATGMMLIGAADAKQNVVPALDQTVTSNLTEAATLLARGRGSYGARLGRAKAPKVKAGTLPGYINPRWDNTRPMFGGGY